MTYCVALRLNRGLVFAADTRTNAGVDNIAQFRKIHYWRKLGERVLVLLTAGNLSLTQSVVSLLNEQLVEREEEPDAVNLYNVPSMYRAARLVGDAVRSIRAIDGPALEATKTGFSGSFILGGQIGKEPPRLFQIYAEGNFIGSFFDLLNPYALLAGLVTVAMFAMHGSLYLFLKLPEGEARDRVRGWMWHTWGVFLVLYILGTMYTLVAIPRATASSRLSSTRSGLEPLESPRSDPT